jgi:hypothetical protein
LVSEDVFSELPERLRTELLAAFGQIVQNYAERRWEPAELNGGKLCEVTYSIVKGKIDGTYPPRAAKPSNMLDACRRLEQATSAPRSLRIQIPRMLIALYEVRNGRNVGHVGGDVDPNHMDAVCVLQMAKWIVAELVRVLHSRTMDQATEIVDALSAREIPLVWKVGQKLRVLESNLSMKDKTLLLLHATPGSLSERELVDFVEHSNPSVFRRDVLRRAHAARLVEYDPVDAEVTISPLGVEHVEKRLLAGST